MSNEGKNYLLFAFVTLLLTAFLMIPIASWFLSNNRVLDGAEAIRQSQEAIIKNMSEYVSKTQIVEERNRPTIYAQNCTQNPESETGETCTNIWVNKNGSIKVTWTGVTE